MNSIKFVATKLLVLLVIFASGCAVSITQESAQRSIDDAYSAIEAAKLANADAYSPENLRKAERLLSDAEDALRRNRRQRAYTLANKAIEMAELAQASIEAYPSDELGAVHSETVAPTGIIEEDIYIPEQVEAEPARVMTKATKKPASQAITQEPTSQEIPIKESLKPKEALPTRWEVSESDVQSRIKAAIQALDEAQRAVQSARLLMFKTQTEMGLSSADATVQRVRENGAPTDVVNMIQTRYNQARKVAAEGNYEAASLLIDQAQTYAQAFLKPVDQNE